MKIVEYLIRINAFVIFITHDRDLIKRIIDRHNIQLLRMKNYQSTPREEIKIESNALEIMRENLPEEFMQIVLEEMLDK